MPPKSVEEMEAGEPTKNFDGSETIDVEEEPKKGGRCGWGADGPGWGRGIVADVKRTVGTHWVQEMTNFNQKTVAVTFFITPPSTKRTSL